MPYSCHLWRISDSLVSRLPSLSLMLPHLMFSLIPFLSVFTFFACLLLCYFLLIQFPFYLPGSYFRVEARCFYKKMFFSLFHSCKMSQFPLVKNLSIYLFISFLKSSYPIILLLSSYISCINSKS